MNEYTTSGGLCLFTPAASLVGIGLYVRKTKLFDPVRDLVKIAQKTVKHSPADKLYDAFISILNGARGLVQINTGLRADPALQMAFGRCACAEQSVVQETLSASAQDNVVQMQQALDRIYRCQSAGYRHDYTKAWQLLDADLSGLPCGKKAALACKGYFGESHHRRGRQMGRVVATSYHEVVVDQLYPGNSYLAANLQTLMTAAELALELDEAKRARTILRIDSGGGTVQHINWALERGYRVHTKDYSAERVQVLAKGITDWVDDPVVPGRQVAWVTASAPQYVQPVRRIAARCRRQNGQWGVGVIVSTLSEEEVLQVVDLPEAARRSAHMVLLAYVYFYDDRGGAIETAIKDDKQGLGITKRNKKRFEAQQMVMMLGTLAHNTVIWARGWLAAREAKLADYGVLRLVRDVFHVSGRVLYDVHTCEQTIILNRLAPLARELAAALGDLLKPMQVTVILDKT